MKFNEEQKEIMTLLEGRKELEGKNLSKTQELLYAALYLRSQGYTNSLEETGGWFTQSNQQLLDLTGIKSKTTLISSIRKLIDLELIERKEGTFNGKIASAYRMCTDKKCTDKSVLIDFEKCTDEERFNFLKEKKLRKSVPMKCTGTENEKCTIDIEVDKEKENRDIMENLEVKQTEDKETELEKALKRIEVLEEKVNYFESNQKTLFETVGELVKRFNSILQNPFFNNIPSADAGNNLPSKGSEIKPEGIDYSNESGKNEPSTGRFNKQQAEELEKSFNYFIKNLRNYDPQEQERAMQAFTSKAKTTYTGDWIERKVNWMENSYRGMWKSINNKQPSKEQTFKEENTKPQPANNGLSETDLYNEINNTFSVENYRPATAQKSRERLQGLISKGNVTSKQRGNLFNHLLSIMHQRDEELKAEKEAQTSPSETNVTNNTTNTPAASNESEMGLPEPTTTNTEGELSTSSDYFRLTYEANQLKNKSEATDFLMNNKNKINALTAGQRAKVLDICRKLIA